MTGPHTENFAEAYAALQDAGAVSRISGRERAGRLPCAPCSTTRRARATRSAAAREAASALGGGVEAALGLIRDHLEPCGRDARAGVLGG